MNKMEKGWMNAPLPPLSQSIIASGLVVGDYKIAQAPHAAKKKIRSSSTISVSSIKKLSSKVISQKSNKLNLPSDSDLLNENEPTTITSAKTSRPQKMHSPLPTSKINLQRKFRPIEQFHIYSQEERNQIYQHERRQESPEKKINCIQSLLEIKKSLATGNISISSRFKSERPTAMDTGKKIVREDTNEIINELDTNISSLNFDLKNFDSLTIEKQVEIKTKLLQFHNFSFNKLILQERAECAERALLMWRFAKFYNQLIGDIPLLMENVQQYTAEYNQKYESLLHQSNEIENNLSKSDTDNNNLRAEIETLKNKITLLTNGNNQKDIQISSITFDFDLAKCQNNQLQTKLKSKKEKIKLLKQSIEKLQDDNKDQVIQIEKMTKTINQMKECEDNLNSIHQSDISKIEKLESKIKYLEKVNFTLTHIEKVDVNIQTNFETQQTSTPNRLLPKPAKKGRSNSINSLTQKPSLSFLTNQKNDIDKKGPKINLSEKEALSRSTPIQLNNNDGQKGAQNQSLTITQPISNHISSNDQINTENNNIENNEVENENSIEKVEIQKIDVDVQTVFHEEETIIEKDKNKVKSDTKGEKNSPEDSNRYSQFKTPNRYSVNHSIIDKLPDLFEIIMPFLSQPFVISADQELRVINTSYAYHKSDKPVVWAIQLIHSFLTDSFVRSTKNQEQTSIESIFVDWISHHYSLQHLVQQAISDFTVILLNSRFSMPFLSFFTEILMGKFSFAQICFLSTIYTFSYDFTFPSMTSLLQSPSFEEERQPMIHIECIEKIISKSFSFEIALNFVKREFVSNFAKKDPMVPFIDFLRKAVILFGEEHRSLYSKSRDILQLCGCSDSNSVTFELFVKFFSLLGIKSIDFKEEWKKALKKLRLKENEKDMNFLNLTAILSICVEKKRPLIKILEADSLNVALGRIKGLSPFVSDLFFDLLSRYSTLLPRVFAKMPKEIVNSVGGCYEKLRKAFLKADVGAVVYLYRLLLNKIDGLMMEEKGFVPFNVNSNSEVIGKLIEYVDRTESISFVLID